MADWLEHRAWQRDAASVSNEVQNYATLLQYARDFHEESWCQDALDEMYDWLDRRQDSQTGYWGYGKETPRERSLGVQTGYHLWLLYFYDARPVHYPERIIDSCLATQNHLGGFGVTPNSSACEDMDSIHPLVHFACLTDYRREDVRRCLERASVWVMANFNGDGGAVFQRGQGFRYGHDLMRTRAGESSMFPTWFRTLSLGYLSQLLSDRLAPWSSWQFLEGPGMQFWR